MLSSVDDVGDEAGRSWLVGLKIVHDLAEITELLVESDWVVSCRWKNHGLGGTLDLEGVTEQVENEGKVKIWKVHKVFLLKSVGTYEIDFKLPAVEPGVVDRGGNFLRKKQKWLFPGVPLDHLNVEVVESVKCWSGIVEALFTVFIAVKLKSHIERLDIVKHSRLWK